MIVLPIHSEIIEYVVKRGLVKKFEQQVNLFQLNPFYPSLETELLEPKHLRFWSFRVDKKYRAIFISTSEERVREYSLTQRTSRS